MMTLVIAFLAFFAWGMAIGYIAGNGRGQLKAWREINAKLERERWRS